MTRIKNLLHSTVQRIVGERGNALVEFALVAPLLFMIVFGMIDFGKAFNYWLDENHLAAQGARLAAVNTTTATCGGTSQALPDYLKCSADTSELKTASVCVSFPDGNAHAGHPVKISVSTTYAWLPIIASLLPSPTTTIAGDATMRLEADSTLTAGCT
jgi:Flp pilus assembly protein TadG